jgi:hypothetical protein
MVVPPTAMMQKRQDIALRIFKGSSFRKYQTQVRVPGLTDALVAGNALGLAARRAAEIGQSKVGPRIAPFVAETGLAGRDQRSTPLDKAAHGGDVLI